MDGLTQVDTGRQNDKLKIYFIPFNEEMYAKKMNV